ncbi:hypothetical protein [Sporosarcina sp.]|uniref:hypothetical protein n=1 Tax=Sporosarcina sp. TaxID=49982 RepID=UPI0026183559|nr:hypothetical protein [Sporosarcina sp.]
MTALFAKSPLSTLEKPIELNRFEDLSSYVKESTEQFKDGMQLHYTVESENGFNESIHTAA